MTSTETRFARRSRALNIGRQSRPLVKNRGATSGAPIQVLAEWTGLEPATPGVTGRYSNQLNYHSLKFLVGADGLEPPTLAL